MKLGWQTTIACIVLATLAIAVDARASRWCGPAFSIANLERTTPASFKYRNKAGRIRAGLKVEGDTGSGFLKCRRPADICNGRTGVVTGTFVPDASGIPGYERFVGTLRYASGRIGCNLTCLVSPETVEPRTNFSCQYLCPPPAAVQNGGFQIAESCF